VEIISREVRENCNEKFIKPTDDAREDIMNTFNLFLRLTLPIILILLSFHIVYAQTGSVTGKVTDRATGDILVGANVMIGGTNMGAAANLEGQFTIPRVPAGEHTLVVSYIGYQRQEVDIVVQAGEVLDVNIELQWAGVQLEEVTISAQARGQVDAINRQLASNTITNIVSADRIRELPDVNAAESIGRLPGVSIHRSGGEANMISIRGLSPKYNTITVNGVRVPSTGGDDRSVDLSLISSNMLAGIEVMKAPTADMDADALGGTVDLRLREAPSDRQYSFSMQGGYNHIQDYYGNYNFTGSISDRFFDNRLGVILNVNLDEYDRSADKFSGDYRHRTEAGETQIVIRELNLREESMKRARGGGSIYFDYRIPRGKVTLNSFYNKLDWDGLHRTNRFEIRPDERHRYDLETREGNTSIFTGGIGVEQEQRWFSYDAGFAMSSTRTNSPDRRQWTFVEEPAPLDSDFIVRSTTHPTEILPHRDPNEFRTWLSEIYSFSTERGEDQTMAQFNVEVPFHIRGSRIDGYIKTGVKFQWLDRFNDETQYGRSGIQYGNEGGPNATLRRIDEAFPEWGIDDIVTEYGGLPISLFLHDYSRDNFLDGDYHLGYVLDPGMMNALTEYLMREHMDTDYWQLYSIGSLGRDYSGEEQYQAGYIMAELNFGRTFTFIPGIRYEKDVSEYHGQRFKEITAGGFTQRPPTDYEEITTERENEFFLPMIHAIIRPNPWLQIRLARTETLTRPDYIQYAPITQINSFNNYGRAANADLKPAHSTNYDVAISVYQNHIGLFTISGFHKNIDDLIFQTRYYISRGFIDPLPGMNIPEAWYSQASPQMDTFINNPYPAEYKGFELDLQTNFWYLPQPFQGIVLNLNYTRIWSEMEKQLYFRERYLIQPPNIYGWELIDTTRVTRMPDQAAHILNATIGYDYRGFSARLSYLYQTDMVAYMDTSPALDHFSGDYARWDLAIRQNIGLGFQVFTNFSNLSNRPDRNFRGDALIQPTYIEYYGFTMDLGFRYNF